MAAGVLQAGDTVRTPAGEVGILVGVSTTNGQGATGTLRLPTGETVTRMKNTLRRVSQELFTS